MSYDDDRMMADTAAIAARAKPAAPSPALTREALAAALHFETCALRTVGTRQCKFWWAHIKQADAIIVRLSEAALGTPPPAPTSTREENL